VNIRFNPLRDTVSGLVGLGSGGIGLVGTGAKKLFIADDSSLLKKVAIGALVTVGTSGLGLLPYLIAGPGARRENQDAKNLIVDNRY
jgi:hypothetical protein